MISFVIPAYNEQKIIQETIHQIRSELEKGQFKPYEIIVVDDGSTDGTGDQAGAAHAKVIRHAHNLGYGRSLKDGIHIAQYDTIVIADSDGTYPIDRLADLVSEYQKGFDMVVGARRGKHLDTSWLKGLLRGFLKIIVEFTSGCTIPDTNSGFRIFSKKTAVQYFPNLSNSFSFTTSMTMAYDLTHRTISYIPIDYRKRVGHTKVHLWRDILRTMQGITEAILFYNPIKLFLCFSIGLFFIGLFFLGLWSYTLCPLYHWSVPSVVPFSIGGVLLFLSILSVLFGLLSIQLKQILHAVLGNPSEKNRE